MLTNLLYPSLGQRMVYLSCIAILLPLINSYCALSPYARDMWANALIMTVHVLRSADFTGTKTSNWLSRQLGCLNSQQQTLLMAIVNSM